MIETEDPVAVRLRALELAIDTVRNARDFSNYQVVSTADLYAKFIQDGTVPTVAREDGDGAV